IVGVQEACLVEIKGGTVTFGGGEGRITRKGTIRTSKLDFENDFKLPDNSQVVLRVPRIHNLYSFNMNELQPEGTLTCLVAKASLDESTKWHRRMAHVNFKNINKLAKNGLVKGLPSKIFFKARTMLADSKLPTMFWTEAVSTACYVLNRVLVTSPHNKTPYELLSRKVPNISHLKPFGCHVTILNTSDHLGKFEGKADVGFIVGYAANRATRFFSFMTVLTSSGQSLGSNEHSTRYPAPSDLGNSHSSSSKDIHHPPSTGIFSSSSYDDDFGADANNLAPTVDVNPIATTRINTVYPQSLILGDPTSSVQTRIEPSSVAQSLEYPGWVDAMQEKMQQFLHQNVWKLMPLPEGKTAIGTKWILKNKRDARGIVVRNKARLVAQGHGQEEGIDYDEVFALVTRIEAIRLFLAFASYMGFLVHQMDVKSAFLYGEIEEEVYVTQPKGFVDPHHPKMIYKVVKSLRGTIDNTLFIKKNSRNIILVQVYVDDIIFGSTKKAWCDDFEKLMKSEFEMSAIGELIFFLGLQVKQQSDGIFLHQEKYVHDILKKFDLESVRTATTLYEAPKPKSNNEPDDVVNVHLYRSMIGSLMYLTALRPDIMFAVSACSRHQVTPLTSNLNAVKKIFKYLKGQPKLGLWYPRDSPFVLEAYSDSDYAGAHGDRKSTTGGCQFLGRRLISWQCKKQTIVATSSTEAEYVAAANCCGQECGASESASVYVSSLHSQHHAHMCFCCFLILVKCFADVPSQVSILKVKIYLET
ncbi:putative ribonuclease H-like domain-containing protein, partial [Tanacetum coccineum]